MGKASTFLQWKGTDVCIDIHCPCGEHLHFDGYFAYTIECAHCHAVFNMPQDLQLEAHEPGWRNEYNHEPKIACGCDFPEARCVQCKREEKARG